MGDNMKPSDPKGLLYPSAERGLEDTKRFLIRVEQLPPYERMKIYDTFLKELANQNRHFMTLITNAKNGNEIRLFSKRSDWCKNSSALTIKARGILECEVE
tara:strand:- start:604 stop:906 length:303 start_codon:yes stop_codon:yes gene_type:complete